MNSRLRRAMFANETDLGHSAAQAPVLVQLPKPNSSILATIALARAAASTLPCGRRASWLTLADTNNIAVGIGGDNSTPTANSCTQNSVLYKGSCAQGALITLTQDDAPVLSYTPEKTLTQMTLLLTTPSLTTGTSYTLVSGGTLRGATTFHGLSIGGTLSGTTTTVTTFTPTSVITQIGTGGQGGNPGGQGGGGNP